MNNAIKKTNCLQHIPMRDSRIAKPNPAAGVPHDNRVCAAATSGFIRYNKSLLVCLKFNSVDLSQFGTITDGVDYLSTDNLPNNTSE